MNIFDVLSLIGGLALFLFGMNIMGDALEKCDGFLRRFRFIKIFSRIIWKEVFVCVKIAAGNIFFCRTEFLMNSYRQMNLLFILFSFGQRTRRGKVFGRCR